MSDTEEEEFCFPPDKKYAVLEMTHDGELYSTPAAIKWLFKKQLVEREGKIIKLADCHWPPDDKGLDDALLRCSAPKDNWIVIKQCRILSSSRTLTGAQESSKAAVNLSSVSESGLDSASFSGKRKRKSTSRYSPSRETDKRGRKNRNDSTSEEESTLRTSPPPGSSAQPKLNLKITEFFKGKNTPKEPPTKPLETEKPQSKSLETEKSQSGSLEAEKHLLKVGQKSDSPLQRDEAKTSEEANHSIGNESPKTVEITTDENEKEELPESREEIELVGAKSKSVDNPSLAFDACSSPSPSAGGRTKPPSFVIRRGITSPTKRGPRGLSAEPVSQRTFTSEIDRLSKKMNEVHIVVKKIYRYTCPVLELTAGDEDDNESPTLPLQSDIELEKFVKHIQDPENKAKAIRHFATFGKSNMNDSVKAMMPKLLADTLAAKFNMEGINRSNAATEKKGFKNTPAYLVILAALKKHAQDLEKRGTAHGYDQESINAFMGLWLKNAPGRQKNSLKKPKGRRNIRRIMSDDEGDDPLPKAG